MYLIDTSVWIDFLKENLSTKTNFLEKLLQDGNAYLCEITYAEICYGAKNDRQFRTYEEYFSVLPFLPLPSGWHQKVSTMGYKLQRAGYKPYTADLLIALTAIEHGVPLLTRDEDFKPYQKLFGLRLE